jgi:hypothetical protein
MLTMLMLISLPGVAVGRTKKWNTSTKWEGPEEGLAEKRGKPRRPKPAEEPGVTRERYGKEKIRSQVKAAMGASEWLMPRSCESACEVEFSPV